MKIEDIDFNKKYKANILTEQNKEIFLNWFDEKDIEETFVVEKIVRSIFLYPQNSTKIHNAIIIDNNIDIFVTELLALFEPI